MGMLVGMNGMNGMMSGNFYQYGILVLMQMMQQQQLYGQQFFLGMMYLFYQMMQQYQMLMQFGGNQFCGVQEGGCGGQCGVVDVLWVLVMWSVGECKMIVEEMMLLMFGVVEWDLGGVFRYGGFILKKDCLCWFLCGFGIMSGVKIVF